MVLHETRLKCLIATENYVLTRSPIHCLFTLLLKEGLNTVTDSFWHVSLLQHADIVSSVSVSVFKKMLVFNYLFVHQFICLFKVDLSSYIIII